MVIIQLFSCCEVCLVCFFGFSAPVTACAGLSKWTSGMLITSAFRRGCVLLFRSPRSACVPASRSGLQTARRIIIASNNNDTAVRLDSGREQRGFESCSSSSVT